VTKRNRGKGKRKGTRIYLFEKEEKDLRICQRKVKENLGKIIQKSENSVPKEHLILNVP
jgi:hypothetical protein